MKNELLRKTRLGISIIEMTVALGIASIIFFTVYELSVASLASISNAECRLKALYLAQEAIEAVRAARNASYHDEIETLTNGTLYYPVLSGNEWTFSISDPGQIDGQYLRSIVFDAVARDSSSNITTSGGTIDPKTRKITASVSWSNRGKNFTITLQSYITNFLNN